MNSSISLHVSFVAASEVVSTYSALVRATHSDASSEATAANVDAAWAVNIALLTASPAPAATIADAAASRALRSLNLRDAFADRVVE